ncbi:MAG: haloacid dehalogenase type II [Candidatus Eremiobacteraeota bacterium]|nr:haloacid dehalogenase type II [Candidatus Eremiobacteraeota bacterium]
MSVAAVVFDLFGTLLDIMSLGAIAAPIVGGDRAPALVARWREKQLAYAFTSTLADRYVDFDALTEHALDYALATLGVTLESAARARLVASWLELKAYPDSILALEALRSRGVRTAVLTNGTLSTAKRVLANSGADAYLDDVWSVEEVRRYKPSPEVYAIATRHLRAEPARIVFISSNGWDATGAAAFGFSVIWCNRGGLPNETFGPAPRYVVSTLADVPALLTTSP